MALAVEGRWRLYSAASDAGLLPDPVSWRLQVPASGVGGAELVYPLDGVRADALTDDLWVGLGWEVMDDGGNWIEPDNCRFLPYARQLDEAAGTLTLQAASHGWLLGKAVRWPDLADTEAGKRVFAGATAGHILGWLHDTATARHAIANLAIDFDDAADSDTVAWRDAIDVEYERGVTTRNVMEGLASTFELVWRTRGYTWQVSQTGRFADWPTAAAILLDGRDVTVEHWAADISDAAGEVLATGQDGTWGSALDSDAGTWGRWQVATSTTGARTWTTLTAAAQAELAGRGVHQSAQATLLPGGPRPFIDIAPGHPVTVLRTPPDGANARWGVSRWGEPGAIWDGPTSWHQAIGAPITELVVIDDGAATTATITIGDVTGSATDLLTRTVRAITGGRVARRPVTGIL